jgi:hypothetical protein
VAETVGGTGMVWHILRQCKRSKQTSGTSSGGHDELLQPGLTCSAVVHPAGARLLGSAGATGLVGASWSARPRVAAAP